MGLNFIPEPDNNKMVDGQFIASKILNDHIRELHEWLHAKQLRRLEKQIVLQNVLAHLDVETNRVLNEGQAKELVENMKDQLDL